VDDPSRWEVVAACDLGLAGATALERAAFLEQLRPGSRMNRAVHAAATEQAGIGSIDDGIGILPRDVPEDELDGM
jgi:hypothetical protein